MAETWVLNEYLDYDFLFEDILFTSNNNSFIRIGFDSDSRGEVLSYYTNIGETVVYINNWLNQAYRTVTFETAPTGDLLTWLQANAEKQEQPSGKTLTVTYNGVDIIDSAEVSGDVAITYDGQTLATLSDGTKTLKCNGKVMKSDVALGGKTLKCSGKRMVSDVVVKVEGEPEPQGDLLLDSNDNYLQDSNDNYLEYTKEA